MDQRPAITVVPYGRRLGFRPARIPLDELNWPLGQPERLRGRTLGDMGPQDHYITYPANSAHWHPAHGVRAKRSLMVVEPSIIHGRHLSRLYRSHRRFFRVLSHDEKLLGAIPNGIFFVYGTTWVPEWRELELSKTAMISLIASAKRSQEGHELRHEMVEWVQAEGLDVDVMGRGYKPFGTKSEGLASYRFSVVIENTRERNYFSEKLIDAILCDTVPIYWGCSNIADFIDPAGMIICETAQEMKAAVQAADQAQYDRLLPALRRARPAADSYCDVEKRAAQAVLESL